MKIFLSYASEDRAVAEEIALAIEGSGHSVFFDRTSLPPGAEYHQRIRVGIDASDLVIFLVSPDSIQKGNFALTELKYARIKWAHPGSRVLPVIVRPVPLDAIPAYLKAVIILEPEGNTAAEVVIALTALDTNSQAPVSIDERSRPRVSVTVEWKRKPEPDPTPRRWVVYIQNSGDTAVTAEMVTVKTRRLTFEIEWGTIQAQVTEDYELDETDFDPLGRRPEADVRFLDSGGRQWMLRGAVLKLLRGSDI